jgi:hypothetical protein
LSQGAGGRLDEGESPAPKKSGKVLLLDASLLFQGIPPCKRSRRKNHSTEITQLKMDC